MTRRWITSKNIILVLMYHRHKLSDLIYIFSSFPIEFQYFCTRLEVTRLGSSDLLSYHTHLWFLINHIRTLFWWPTLNLPLNLTDTWLPQLQVKHTKQHLILVRGLRHWTLKENLILETRKTPKYREGVHMNHYTALCRTRFKRYFCKRRWILV
jgi:hypothetical protein